MEPVDLILMQHAWTHSTAVSDASGPTSVDRLLLGLSAEQLRARPAPAANSIIWLLWHAARIEDAAINGIVAGGPQVLECDGWGERLGVAGRQIGTGMGDAEVA